MLCPQPLFFEFESIFFMSVILLFATLSAVSGDKRPNFVFMLADGNKTFGTIIKRFMKLDNNVTLCRLGLGRCWRLRCEPGLWSEWNKYENTYSRRSLTTQIWLKCERYPWTKSNRSNSYIPCSSGRKWYSVYRFSYRPVFLRTFSCCFHDWEVSRCVRVMLKIHRNKNKSVCV